MGFFDITYSSIWQKLVPPSKWGQNVLDWGTALLSPLQWLRDLTFGSYANSDIVSPAYSLTAVYVKGSRVRYNNRIYECINAPIAVGDLPTDTTNWILIQNDWRGVYERVAYDGQKLILEYVLNRWFNTTFNQPPNTASSTYFITKLVPIDNTFLIGANDNDTGMIAGNAQFQTDFIGVTYTVQPYDFQVNYPISITADQYKQMASLVSQYKLYGSNPIFISY